MITAAGPLLSMAVVALFFIRRAGTSTGETSSEIHLESPVSLKRVLVFAALFLFIQVVSRLGERYFGRFGFLAISVLGGLVSSASTTAAAANMVGHGQMRASRAGGAVVLASVASALINLPIVYRNARNSALSRQLTVLTLIVSLVGVAVFVLQEYYLARRIAVSF